MSLIEIIYTILITSLVCNGIYILFDEGGLFHFLQKPYLSHQERVKQWKDKQYISIDQGCDSVPERAKRYLMVNKEAKLKMWYMHLLKPLFLCVGCMASIWGGLTFVALHGMNQEVVYVFVCCIGAIPVNFIIFKLHDNA